MAAWQTAAQAARQSLAILLKSRLPRNSFTKEIFCKRAFQGGVVLKAQPPNTMLKANSFPKPKWPNPSNFSFAKVKTPLLRIIVGTAFGCVFIVPAAVAWLVYLAMVSGKNGEIEDVRRSWFIEDKICFQNKCLSEDSVQWKRVDGILKKLILANQHDHDGLVNFDWTVTIICSESEEAAYAFPNGHFYITTKFLSALDTDSKLANTVAHEMAHVYHGHARDKLYYSDKLGKALAFFALLPLSKKEERLMAIVPIAKFLATESLQRTPYTRCQEFEADETAAFMVSKASYDPREGAATLIMRDAKEKYGDGIIFSQYYEVHPYVHERAPKIIDSLAKKGEVYPPEDGINPIDVACKHFEKMENSQNICL
ncbi:metalloendopeptidase OMA1, mitochondrial-like [Watersipora subatra]|uniref:metalloendopeptidase OMA1, mitochondrial-like n=1 Tax=Watersipora subatra TaxID=2589382 RepID=UPI00355B4F3F